MWQYVDPPPASPHKLFELSQIEFIFSIPEKFYFSTYLFIT